MTLTYLVPLDGSELAEQALPYALKLATANAGRLVLVRVAITNDYALPEDFADKQQEAIRTSEDYLAMIASRVAGQIPIDTAVPYGRAASEILEEVNLRKADCVVMATHGRTGLAHLVYGSVAEEVVAHSHVPVLLVRARPGSAASPSFEPDEATVLVALDGSRFSEAALDGGLQVLGSSGRLVVLTTVVEPPDGPVYDEAGRIVVYVDQREESARSEALDYLYQAAANLRQRYPGRLIDMDVRLGKPAEGLVEAERDRSAALTIIATHGRTGLGRMILGSVAGEVLARGATPVLLVRPLQAVREPAAADTARALNLVSSP
jgi:nucleotide-binding universal stress UspA family protein